MVNKRSFALGLLLGTLAAGCAGFTYRFYGLDAASYEGHLLGPNPSDDLLLSVCQPDASSKGKCVVYLVDEHERMKAEFKRLEIALKDCQASH